MQEPISREDDLYHLWERRALPGVGFRAAGGERIVVVSPGVRNRGAGPDYLGAVLLVDGAIAVGAVEMHMTEGEWFAHGHQHDRAYDGVILHLLGALDSGALDPPLRLPIPSVAAATLDAAMADAAAAGGESSPGMDDAPEGTMAPGLVTPDLIAELAWARLLRRATEIIRFGGGDATSVEHREGWLRRAFVRRLFDALGYAANRAPMGGTIGEVLGREEALAVATFDEVAAAIFGASGLERERIVAAGSGFMSESRLRDILKNCDLPPQIAEWRYDTRPANAPERRLWGAAKLVHDIYQHDLLLRLHEAVEAREPRSIAAPLTVRLGGSTFVGAGRVREIVINALLPVALAAGITGAGTAAGAALAEGACHLYREAPSLGTNRIVRRIEERFLPGFRLDGAFWQQGAIEFHQRYLLPDRSSLSFVAEHGRALRRSPST